MQFLYWLRWFVTKIPIYGQLINTDGRSISAAFLELIIATVFSLLPIWLYPIIMKVGFGESFWSNASSFVQSGELFLFASALVGPLIYSITKSYGEEGEDRPSGERAGFVFPRIRAIRFPYGIWFVLISVFVCLFSAIFFGLMRVNSASPLAANLDKGTLLLVAGFMYLFTLSCFFCVSVYRLNLENISQAFGSDTRNLMDEWEHRDD